ncbi:MAG: EAL domain-containing protein [Sedimenticola sp.]
MFRGDDQSASLKVFREQISLLYGALPGSLPVIMISAAVVSYVLWGSIDSELIVSWLILVSLVTLLRLWVKRAYDRVPDDSKDLVVWGNRFLVGTLLSGITWGIAGYVLFPTESVVGQAFLAFILGGMSAGAVTTLSPLFPVAASFLIPALLPVIWRFFSVNHEISLPMGGMLLLFLFMMLVVARRNAQATAESLTLRFLAIDQGARIRESDEEKNLLLESVAEGVFGVDLDGITTFVNPAASRMLGYPPSALVGQPIHELIHHSHADGSEYPADYCPMNCAIRKGKVYHVDDEVLWREDGTCFHVDYYVTPVFKQGEMIGAVVTFRDITDRRETEQVLESERRLFITGPTVVFTWEAEPNWPVSYVSPNFEKQFGYRWEELIHGRIRYLDLIHPEDREYFLDSLKDRIREHADHIEMEYRLRNAEGEYRWVYVVTTMEYRERGKVSRYHGHVIDITERKQAEAKVEYQAYYDPLTSLFNRRLLLNRLQKDLARSQRHGHYGALLFIDLDRFKTINDSLGHAVGDGLLQEVAQRLLNNLRDEDTAARLGGDEFVVLLSEVSNDEESTAIHAQQVAEKMRRALAEPYQIQGNRLHLSASIGIALFPDEGHTAEDLLKHADIAMYRAKDQGRNDIRFFLPSMQQAAYDRLVIEKDLRQAVERGEFVLQCQPQFGRNGELLGGEALIRWQHPDKGLISPVKFIPVSEETGMILQIGDWVLREACSQVKAWVAEGVFRSGQHLSVNVSAYQFRQRDFVQRVKDIFSDSGVDPSFLVFELTEGVVLADVEDTIRKMEALRELGVEIAMDDFGTGYSSLSYLKQLPLNTLKIDRSFVMDIDSDPNDAAIVQTIISMARHMGLDVIAEGVETEQHRIFLQASGCYIYQGFLFSRPEPMEDFRRRLYRAAGIDESVDSPLKLVKK